MSENQGTAQNNTSGVTSREFDIHLWEDLYQYVCSIYDDLDESGCIWEDEKEYYKSLKEALTNVYHQYLQNSSEEHEKAFKETVVKALKEFVGKLLWCI